MRYLLLMLFLAALSTPASSQKTPKLKEMRAYILDNLQPNAAGIIEIDSVVTFPDQSAETLYKRSKQNIATSSFLRENVTYDDDIKSVTVIRHTPLEALGLTGFKAKYRWTLQFKDGRVRYTSAYMGMGPEGQAASPANSAPFKRSISKKFDNIAVRCAYSVQWNKEKDFNQMMSMVTSSSDSDW